MKTNPFNDFWRGKEVKTEPSKIQKSDFKTLWKGGEAALAKGAMDELKNYIQLRLDQNIPQDKALDQAIAVNGRLPEMKRLDPSEVETLVEQVYNKSVQKAHSPSDKTSFSYKGYALTVFEDRDAEGEWYYSTVWKGQLWEDGIFDDEQAAVQGAKNWIDEMTSKSQVQNDRVFSGGEQEDAKQDVRTWRRQGKSKDYIVSRLMQKFDIPDFGDAENFYELVTKSQVHKDFKEWEHFEVHYQWEKIPNKGRGDSGSESVTVPAESAEEAHRLVEENFKRIHPGYKFYFGAVVKKSQVQKGYDKDFSVAHRMMARENSIQDSLGLNGGDQSNNPDFLAKVKMMDTSGINPNVMAILEDENYHSLVSALIQVKGAPHPANEIKYDKPR